MSGGTTIKPITTTTLTMARYTTRIANTRGTRRRHEASAVRGARTSRPQIIAREVRHQTVELTQLGGRREKDDAEKTVGGRQPKTRSVHTEDAGRTEQREHVFFVGSSRRQRNL